MQYHFLIISQKDVKIIVLGVLIGGILQMVSYKYLKKNYPELLTDNKTDSIRGGALVEVSVTGIKFILILAKKGVWIGFTTAALRVGWDKIPRTSLSTLAESLRKGLPLAHSNYEINYNKKFIIIDGEKIWLDQCDQNLEYLFKVLNDKNISIQEKNDQCLKILMNYLNLNTHRGRLNFIICLLSLLRILSIVDFTSYHILIGNLIKALKAGKLPKKLVRLILRKLLRQKIPVDPELLELVDLNN